MDLEVFKLWGQSKGRLNMTSKCRYHILEMLNVKFNAVPKAKITYLPHFLSSAEVANLEIGSRFVLVSPMLWEDG